MSARDVKMNGLPSSAIFWYRCKPRPLICVAIRPHPRVGKSTLYMFISPPAASSSCGDLPQLRCESVVVMIILIYLLLVLALFYFLLRLVLEIVLLPTTASRCWDAWDAEPPSAATTAGYDVLHKLAKPTLLRKLVAKKIDGDW